MKGSGCIMRMLTSAEGFLRRKGKWSASTMSPLFIITGGVPG